MAATHVLYDVDPVAITLCKKGANRQRFFLRKSDDTGDLLTLPASHRLLKASDWSAVYCVVAEPGAEENGGLGAEGVVDVWRDEEEIRKAAHRFSKNRAYVNAMHGAMAEQGCHVVENAVALTDFDVDGVTIRKGSWYLAIEPSPDVSMTSTVTVARSAANITSASSTTSSMPTEMSSTRAIPAWMAPVCIVTPRKPPMTRMNSATSMAPNSSPEL